MRVACYVRVSTENQLENYSIEEQTERLKAYCKAKGYDNYEFYTDGGYSGGNLNRPGLQTMLHAIKDGQISAVLVYKLDRLSRSQKDTLNLIEDSFLANGVNFISMNENFDTTTPFGRAMIGILSTFAQLEKDQITERFMMGRVGRAKAGYYYGGCNPPIGYDYKDGMLVINEYEAGLVRDVYDQFLKGKSINSIRAWLETRYKTRTGATPSNFQVRCILDKPVYIGKVKFNGTYYDGIHEPIIDLDTFYLVQKRLNDRERNTLEDGKERAFKASTLLSGIIYCKRCGARYHGTGNFYVCYSRSKKTKKMINDPNCKNKRWKIEELNNIVIDQIRLIDVEDYKETKKSKTNTDQYKKRISDIEKQIENLVELYQVGGIPIDTIKKKIDKLNVEKADAVQRIDESKKKLNNKSALITNRNRLLDIVENGDLSEQRMLISNLIKRIDIDGEDIYISWKI